MPDGPGPGYWPGDPALAGWEQPSQFIWEQRISSSPGVVWTRPSADWRGAAVLGALGDGTVVVFEDGRLLGLSVKDGSLRWSQASSIRATRGVIDWTQSMLYTANQYTGGVEAFLIQDQQRSGEHSSSVCPLVSVWDRRLDASGSTTLIPLPNGGVVASFGESILGISALGQLLWTHDIPGWRPNWEALGDQLFVSMTGEDAAVWEVDEAGLSVAAMPVGGQLITRDGQLVVFGEDGVYLADPDTHLVDLLYGLPTRRLEPGGLVAFPDGGFLLLHADAFDVRLVALEGDGTLRWQRSVARTLRGNELHLLMVDGYALLASQCRSAFLGELSIFGIDMDRGRLVRLFESEGWSPRLQDGWVYPVGDDCALLNIGSGTGGGRLVALDIRDALESAIGAMNSR